MNAVRARHGYASSIADIDVSNGIVMLQTLNAVASEAFIMDGSVTADVAAVRMHFDEQGDAACENVRRGCGALRRFPWYDGSGQGRLLLTVDDAEGIPMSPYPFERVDAWSLVGFIVLVAVTGSRAGDEVEEMLKLGRPVNGLLSAVT